MSSIPSNREYEDKVLREQIMAVSRDDKYRMMISDSILRNDTDQIGFDYEDIERISRRDTPNYFTPQSWPSWDPVSKEESRIVESHSDAIKRTFPYQIIENPVKVFNVMRDVLVEQLSREEKDVLIEKGLFFTHDINQPIYDGGSIRDICLLRFRIKNLPITEMIPLHELKSNFLWKLIRVSGVVCKTHPVKSRAIIGAFRCSRCFEFTYIGQEPLHPKQCTPMECCNCERPHSQTAFREIERDGIYSQTRHIEIKESPDNRVAKDLNLSLQAVLSGDMVNEVGVGDSVVLTGILLRSKTGELADRSFILQVNDIENKDRDDFENELTLEDISKIKTLGNDPKVIEKLRDSIAPSLFGLQQIKESILLQIVGGVRKELPDGTTIRGDIHSLWVGEPGVGKSSVHEYIQLIAPRCIHASGRGSSGVGFTATAIKEKDGGFQIHGGAMVQANGAILIADEFNKMRDEDKGYMHEAMEKQRISIHKGGIDLPSISTKCTLLAAANPKKLNFTKKQHENVSDELNIDDAIRTRFDFIWAIRGDDGDEDRILDHIINTRNRTTIEDFPDCIEPELMTKVFIYCSRLTPKITNKAFIILKAYYKEIRRKDKASGEKAITLRKFNDLVRTTEAYAKLRQSEIADEKDANRAIFIHDAALSGVEGRSSYIKGKRENIINCFKNNKGIGREELINLLLSQFNYQESDIHSLVSKLVDDGEIHFPVPKIKDSLEVD